MKLTREGAARLGRHESRGFPVGDFEFKPEDFDGCFQNGKDHMVCLTVEEAKEVIADYIDVVAEVVRQRNKSEIKIKHPKSILILMEQIGQTEKKDAND